MKLDANTTAGVEHPCHHGLGAEVFGSFGRGHGEVQRQDIGRLDLRILVAALAREQHAVLTEVANRAQPRPPFRRVHQCRDRNRLPRVAAALQVVGIRPGSTTKPYRIEGFSAPKAAAGLLKFGPVSSFAQPVSSPRPQNCARDHTYLIPGACVYVLPHRASQPTGARAHRAPLLTQNGYPGARVSRPVADR